MDKTEAKILDGYMYVCVCVNKISNKLSSVS